MAKKQKKPIISINKEAMYKNKINLKKTYLNGLKLLLELTVLVLFIYIIPTILKKLIFINGTLKIALGYLFVAFPYLILRYVVSLFYEPYPTQHINERITVIVPFYNEDKKTYSIALDLF